MSVPPPGGQVVLDLNQVEGYVNQQQLVQDPYDLADLKALADQAWSALTVEKSSQVELDPIQYQLLTDKVNWRYYRSELMQGTQTRWIKNSKDEFRTIESVFILDQVVGNPVAKTYYESLMAPIWKQRQDQARKILEAQEEARRRAEAEVLLKEEIDNMKFVSV